MYRPTNVTSGFGNDLQNMCPAIPCQNSRDRIVVSTLRCGRNNPGSNPGHGNFFFQTQKKPFSFFFFILYLFLCSEVEKRENFYHFSFLSNQRLLIAVTLLVKILFGF